MKKKHFILIGAVVILVLAWFWYISPVTNLVGDGEVEKITFFDGRTGNGFEVTAEEEIAHIVNNLNSVKMKRDGISLFYLGYHYRTTIVYKNGRTKEFIINSSTAVRDNPFFYAVTDGEIDIDFITTLMEQNKK